MLRIVLNESYCFIPLLIKISRLVKVPPLAKIFPIRFEIPDLGAKCLPFENYVSKDLIHYSKVIVKLASLVEGDQKAPFSIATTPRCRGGRHSFPWIAPVYTYLVLLSVKQGGIKYHFKSTTWPGIEPRSPDHWRTLYSQGHYSNLVQLPNISLAKNSYFVSNSPFRFAIPLMGTKAFLSNNRFRTFHYYATFYTDAERYQQLS